MLIEMVLLGQGDLGCFDGGKDVVMRELRERIFPTNKVMNRRECKEFINELISQAHDNWRTVMYDKI